MNSREWRHQEGQVLEPEPSRPTLQSFVPGRSARVEVWSRARWVRVVGAKIKVLSLLEMCMLRRWRKFFEWLQRVYFKFRATNLVFGEENCDVVSPWRTPGKIARKGKKTQVYLICQILTKQRRKKPRVCLSVSRKDNKTNVIQDLLLTKERTKKKEKCRKENERNRWWIVYSCVEEQERYATARWRIRNHSCVRLAFPFLNWEEMGVKSGVDERRHLANSTPVFVRFLKKMKNK